MEINLLVEKYQTSSNYRQTELDICLFKNTKNELITKIWLFGNDFNKIPKSNKINTVETTERVKFSSLFNFASNNIEKDQLCIIANSDIFFDDTLALINPGLLQDASFTLSRWDVMTDGSRQLFNHANSADSWFFLSPLLLPDADFHLGLPGCDNKLAYLLREANRAPSNPSKSIKSYHLHLSNKRNAIRESVPPPYLLVHPTTLTEHIPTVLLENG